MTVWCNTLRSSRIAYWPGHRSLRLGGGSICSVMNLRIWSRLRKSLVKGATGDSVHQASNVDCVVLRTRDKKLCCGVWKSASIVYRLSVEETSYVWILSTDTGTWPMQKSKKDAMMIITATRRWRAWSKQGFSKACASARNAIACRSICTFQASLSDLRRYTITSQRI